MCYTPSSNCFPSSPTSSVSSFSHLTAASNSPPSPVFRRLDVSVYTSSPVQARYFASHQPTSSLAPSPRPIDLDSSINPNGPIDSFTPGKLSLDSVTTMTSDHPVPYCPIASTCSPSVYSMYSPFPFLPVCLVVPPIGERVVRSVSQFDYLICFLSRFRLLYVPVLRHY